MFFKKLASKYKNINIKRFLGRKRCRERSQIFIQNEVDVYLKGKADLVIESDIGNEIIDYKTGGSQKNQLIITLLFYLEMKLEQRKTYF